MSAQHTPEPGAYWHEQQGHYAGLMVAPDGRSAWHLILPDVAEFPNFEGPWGRYGQAIAGASSVYDGHANTLAMAEAGSELAKALRALPGDCYLPSRAEALMLFATLRVQFEPVWHWTSTQSSANHAWHQNFRYGNQNTGYEQYEGRARAVRRLVLQSFDPFARGTA